MQLLVSRRTSVLAALISAALVAPAAASAAPAPANLSIEVGQLKAARRRFSAASRCADRVRHSSPVKASTCSSSATVIRSAARPLTSTTGPAARGLFRPTSGCGATGASRCRRCTRRAPDSRAHPARARSSASATPTSGQGKCGRVVRAFKKELHKLGYVPSGGSCFGGQGCPRRARLSQGQRRQPHLPRRRRNREDRIRGARCVPAQVPERRQATSRCRSRSRSS